MKNILKKQQLTDSQLKLVEQEFNKKKKDSLAMYLIWLFFGALGGHRFYLGDIGMGIAQLLTLGGLGFWSLIDVAFIDKRLQLKNEIIESDIIDQIKGL